MQYQFNKEVKGNDATQVNICQPSFHNLILNISILVSIAAQMFWLFKVFNVNVVQSKMFPI